MSEQAIHVNGFSSVDDSKVCYWKQDDGWWIYLPQCGAGRMPHHRIEEHEDGTISVTPSIVLTGHNAGNPTTRHGYLTKGIWNEA